MTTYKEIFGKQIKQLSTDPTDAQAEGQVWYNTTSGTFKTVLSVGAWASGGNVNTARRYVFGAGTQTASLLVNGYATGFSNASEEYNGSSWTSVTNAPFSVYNSAGGGIQTAAFLTGGDLGTTINQVTGEYDGSNWTTTNNNPNAKNGGGGCGTQTAGLYAGGQGSNGTQTYDGSWTSTGHTLNSPRTEVACAMTGTSTAALIVGSQPSSDVVEEYNGSSWTAQTVVPTAGYARSSSGIQTAALYYGGGSTGFGGTTAAEYDGSSWTNVADLATPRGGGGSGKGAGTSSLAFMAAGQTPGPTNSNQTEEFSYSIYSPIAATWASGGALSTGRESLSSAGTQTAALAVGGRVGPPGGTTAVESYDGSSMSSAPSLNTARQYAGGCGTQTAAITYANFPVSGATEEYNGSSWSTQPNSMATARRSFASFGIQTAALAAGGTTGPAVSSLTEEYNGTSWTAGGALSQARQYFAGAGIETSGLVFGGSDNPNSTKYTNTEEYGGTSWTAGGVLPTGTSGLMGCGATQTAALAFGGYQPSKVATTVEYDGSAWSSKPAMGGATAEGSGAGTNVAGLSIGGSPAETGVEEFTGEIVQLDYKTLTSS